MKQKPEDTSPSTAPEDTESAIEIFDLMDTCKFHFRTLEDLERLVKFCQLFFQNRSNAMTGVYAIGLNAIEHGILGIGYEFKAELLAENRWKEEILRRLNDPAYENRRAEFVITRKDGGTYIIITDPGKGFEWERFINIDPGRAGQKHGRGISIAKSLSFDKLSYNEAGNQAIGFIADDDDFSW